MKLIPAEGVPGKDRPHVYGVETIQLIANPSHPKNPHVYLEAQVPQGDEFKPAKVKCSGDLEYSVITHTAVLTTDVVVWTGLKGKEDILECYRLTMQFAPKKRELYVTSTDAKSKSDEELRREKEFQHVETDLEFSWLLAESQFEAEEGRHGPLVKIISREQKISASMGRLAYDAETRILSMSSNELKPGSTERKPFVQVKMNRSELKVPAIEVELGESANEQISLKSLICLGAGELFYVDEKTGKLAFKATWQKQLSKKTDPETNLDLVELEEDAQFRQPEHYTGLGAELIKIWLVPLNITSPGKQRGQSSELPQPEPIRLLAQNRVVLLSPHLQIERTNELDIRFEETNDTSANLRTRYFRTNLRPVAMSSMRSQPIGFASIPAERTLWPPVTIPDDADSTPPSRKLGKSLVNPIVVSADRIGVRMRRIPGQQNPDVLAVNSEGKVNISLERVPGQKPTTLEGDRIRLDNQTSNHEVIDVYGSPARIRDQKFRIDGKEIHLDRGKNEAKVDGAGLLQVPIPKDVKIPGMEGATNRDLTVRWDESMNFDGLTSKFIGSVEAKLGLASMKCEQMNLELMERIEFQAASAETKPAIRTIDCRQKVKFKNATRSGKILIDQYRGEVAEFSWDHSSGIVTAQGPGEIQVWRRQTTGDSPFAQRDTIQANRPIPVVIPEWDYTQVQFEGKLMGRIEGQLNGPSDRQKATIEDRVKVTHGPVRSPTDEVNPDELPSKAGTIHCDQLEFVNHTASARNPVEYRRLIGSGNAEIEGQVDGRRFTASAHEIIFNGLNGMYVLRGTDKQPADLTYVGSGTIPGRRIEFNPKTKFLNVERATGGQWSSAR
jgi:lipopolysaccharide export system protein LptA